MIVWGSIALLAATQQWAELRGTLKEIAWWQAFAWQGVSWLLLIPATPVVYARTWGDRARGLSPVGHVVVGLAVGAAFVLASLPARLAFHPGGVRWALFGEAFYKSVVAYGAAGAVAYGLAVLAAAHLDARSRLRTQPSAPSPPERIALPTPVGVTHQHLGAVLWAEPATSGATLHTDAGDVLVCVRLGELEQRLEPLGFVRTHRGCLINGRRVREVIGGASRDGLVRLDSGHTLPVSRRRRSDLDRALTDLAGRRNPGKGVPLGA